MFKNASSTWIAEIATIEASSFCFSPAKSILVIHTGQFGWPVVSIRDTKFLVAGKHHDQNEVADQRQVDQGQDVEDGVGRLGAGCVQDELPQHSREFEEEHREADDEAEIERRH